MSIIPFSFEGEPVRFVLIDGISHGVGKDVCDRLGYANANKAMNDHCKGVTIRYPLSTPGGIQEVRVLAEADILRLIVRSKLPAAVRFERWLFEEVVPAIRQTGGYLMAAPEETPEQLALRAMAVMQATIDRQKQQIAIAAPKAAALDLISTADGHLTITAAAKTLQIRPRDLFAYMLKNRWIYRVPNSKSYLGYQTRTDAGDLVHKVTDITKPGEKPKIARQVLVTPRGLTKLAAALSQLNLN